MSGKRSSRRVIDTPLTRIVEDGGLVKAAIRRAIEMGLIEEGDLAPNLRTILRGGSCRIRFTDVKRRADGKPIVAAGNILAFDSGRKKERK